MRTFRGGAARVECPCNFETVPTGGVGKVFPPASREPVDGRSQSYKWMSEEPGGAVPWRQGAPKSCGYEREMAFPLSYLIPQVAAVRILADSMQAAVFVSELLLARLRSVRSGPRERPRSLQRAQGRIPEVDLPLLYLL